MGMYTEFVFAAKLKRDVPKQVIDTLRWMVDSDEPPKELPDHPLFSYGMRTEYMLRCDSYYFNGKSGVSFEFDDISNAYYLTVRTNLKNYGDEIEEFIDWINPYLDTYGGDFLGYYLYEELSIPNLIYSDKVIHFEEPERAVVLWKVPEDK